MHASLFVYRSELRFTFSSEDRYVNRDTYIYISILYIYHTYLRRGEKRRIILIELVIWKLKLLIRTNRIDNYEASNTREFPWTVLQRHVTSHRERSFDIHAIFTLVSVVRVRNIAISINVLNFFSRPPRDLLLTFAIGFPEDSHSSPLLTSTLYTNRPTIGTFIRNDASIEFASSFLFSSRSRVFCHYLLHQFYSTPYLLFLPINVIEIFSGNF